MIQTTALRIEKVDKAAREFVGILTCEAPDFAGDVVVSAGVDWSQLRKLPALLSDHQLSSRIGTWQMDTLKAVTVDGFPAWQMTGRLFAEGTNDIADQRWRELQEGGASGISVSFISRKWEPTKDGGRRYLDALILEASLVGLPACGRCLVTEVRKRKCMCGGTAKARVNDEVLLLPDADDLIAVEPADVRQALRELLRDEAERVLKRATREVRMQLTGRVD